MNDQESTPNSNRYAKGRVATRPISASRFDGGIDQNQSSRFTKLVAERALSQPPKETPVLNRDQIMTVAGDARYNSHACPRCGGTMKKSSRAILSIPAGIALIAFGAALMAFYGYATNFYQFPWFVRFALPAAYYVGSIFVGVGILFFFVRERIWRCKTCGEAWKR